MLTAPRALHVALCPCPRPSQLNKAQQDKAADAAAKKKRGEAAKAKAADAARLEAEAASKADTSGEMDGRMLSALITGERFSKAAERDNKLLLLWLYS